MVGEYLFIQYKRYQVTDSGNKRRETANVREKEGKGHQNTESIAHNFACNSFLLGYRSARHMDKNDYHVTPNEMHRPGETEVCLV